MVGAQGKAERALGGPGGAGCARSAGCAEESRGAWGPAVPRRWSTGPQDVFTMRDVFCPPWSWQVCNNLKNCHCDPGWSPPQCKTRGSSIGGSTDSALGPGECRGQALGAPWFYRAQRRLSRLSRRPAASPGLYPEPYLCFSPQTISKEGI